MLKDCTKLRNSTKGFGSTWKMNEAVTIYQLNNKNTNCNVMPVSLECFKGADGTITNIGAFPAEGSSAFYQ